MENIKDRIIEKLDRLIEIQSGILDLLNHQGQKVELDIKPQKPKAELILHNQDNFKYWFLNRYYLKEKFNLVAAPQIDVCIEYKNTGNDRIFDRFKRNKL